MSTKNKHVTWASDSHHTSGSSRSRSSGKSSRSSDKSSRSRSSVIRRSCSPEWRRSRSRSPELTSGRRSRTSSDDDYSRYRSEDYYKRNEVNSRRSEDTDLTNKISKIVDKKLERTDTGSSRYYRQDFSPEFRHPMNQPMYPWPAFFTCGCSFMNQYHGSYVGCDSWNPSSRSSTFSNPHTHIPVRSRHCSPCSRENSSPSPTETRRSTNNCKGVVVEKKIKKLLKKVSENPGDKLKSRSKVPKPSKTIVKKVLGSDKASASQSIPDQHVAARSDIVEKLSSSNKASTAQPSSGKSAPSQKEIEKKVLISNTASATPTSKKSAQGDQSVPGRISSFEDEDDDLIFLEIVDKNDLKEDVEVIVISDGEDEEKEDDNESEEDVLDKYLWLKLEDINSDEEFDQNGKSDSPSDALAQPMVKVEIFKGSPK